METDGHSSQGWFLNESDCFGRGGKLRLGMKIEVREFRGADVEACAELYRASVRALGAAAYSTQQVEAWAKYPEDLEEFRARLLGGVALVAEVEGVLAGFGSLWPISHVDFLYTGPGFYRRGVASALYAELEKIARERGLAALDLNASRFSRALFERLGFEVFGLERVVRSGVEFERALMRKRLR